MANLPIHRYDPRKYPPAISKQGEVLRRLGDEQEFIYRLAAGIVDIAVQVSGDGVAEISLVHLRAEFSERDVTLPMFRRALDFIHGTSIAENLSLGEFAVRIRVGDK